MDRCSPEFSLPNQEGITKRPIDRNDFDSCFHPSRTVLAESSAQMRRRGSARVFFNCLWFGAGHSRGFGITRYWVTGFVKVSCLEVSRERSGGGGDG